MFFIQYVSVGMHHKHLVIFTYVMSLHDLHTQLEMKRPETPDRFRVVRHVRPRRLMRPVRLKPSENLLILRFSELCDPSDICDIGDSDDLSDPIMMHICAT